MNTPTQAEQLIPEENAHDAMTAALESMANVPFTVSFELAQTSISIRRLLELQSGAVLPLEASCVQTVQLVIDGERLARGEIISLQNNYGVRITEFEDISADDDIAESAVGTQQ